MKFKKNAIAFFVIFLMILGFYDISNIKNANAYDQRLYYETGKVPSSFRLRSFSKSEMKKPERAGTLTKKGYDMIQKAGEYAGPSSRKKKAGDPHDVFYVENKQNKAVFCVEYGPDMEWGNSAYRRKGVEYIKSNNPQKMKYSKLISYGLYNDWSPNVIQALIWSDQGGIKLNSKFKKYENEFNAAFKKNLYDPRFYGAHVYGYEADRSYKFQTVVLVEYKKPTLDTEITLKKWEQSKKIYTGGHPTFAINQAGKALYSLNGAQYGIYKTKADAQAKRNPYKTVNLSGDNPAQAKFKLPANTIYYAREIKAPAKGYHISNQILTIDTHSGNKMIQPGDVAKTDPLKIVIRKTNNRKQGLEGAKFEVRYYNQMLTKAQAENATPTKRWIYKSDSNGRVELNNKAHKIGGDTLYMDAPDGNVIGLYGTYTIREIEAPEGYIPSKEVAWGQVKEGSRLNLLFNNSSELPNESQKGKIGIAKTDKETGKGLTGIKFNVKLLESYDSASDVKAGTVVDTITSGQSVQMSKDLPLGKYEITEDRSSIDKKGYQILQKPIIVNIKGNKSGNEFTNAITYEENSNLDKAKTRIYGSGSNAYMGIFITNNPQKGVLTLNKRGNQLVGTKQEKIEGYTVTRPTLQMLDLANTKWELRAAEDIYSADGTTKFYSKGELADTLITTNKTSADVKSKELPLGKYTLTEVKAPSPFQKEKDEGKQSITIEFTKQEPEVRLDLQTERKVNERKNIKFKIEKEFEGSKNFTENPEAVFGLYLNEDYSENGVTIVKDTLLDVVRVKAKDGKTEVKDSAKEQKSFEIQEYDIVEVDDKTKPIYKGEDSYTVTIKDTDGNTQTKYVKTESDAEKYRKFANDNGYDVEIVKNSEKKHVGYQKKEERQKVGKAIVVNTVEDKNDLIAKLTKEGKDFDVKEIAYQGEGKESQKVKINRVIEGEFRELPIDGKFYVKEIANDGNYVTDSNKYTNFDFGSTTKKDNEKKVDKFTNRLIRVGINLFKFEEGSREDGKDIPVKGAVYKLVAVDDKKGESVIGHYTTDEKGNISVDKLEPGKYYLQEVTAPEGYFLNENKIYFNLDGKNVKDKEVVKKETQDEKKPNIGTTATDNETGKKEHNPTKTVKIKDRVRYKDLVVGKTYKLVGKLKFKEIENGKVVEKPVIVNGKEVVKEVTFKPTQRNGYYDLVIEVPGEVVRGKETVVFENLYRDGRMVAVHNDIFDEGQTTKTVNPEIGTRLADVDTKKKVLNPISKIVLKDKVYYKDLVVGEEYKLRLNLWNRATNDYVKDANGNRLVVEKTFIPKVKTGTVDVDVKIDLSKFKGIDLVALEELSYKGEILATHKDKEDKNQTIKVMNPKIKTKFATIDGKKYVSSRLPVTLVDTVSFTDLVPGERYEISAIVMNKETKKPVVIDGKTVEVKIAFTTPNKANQENGGVSGTIEVPVKLNLGGYKGEDIVMFETLRYKGEIITEHKDINDKDQTIKVKNHYALPTTGGVEVAGSIIMGAMTMLSMAGVSIKRSRKN